ncbi:DUF58 domain-containing protein [Radiobacillus sp. PE A8.2]|uniref:DUF58 domain-containing protein n=1 Tax=Radiobacillus sp. PE A8.2 TaxID=3380349 RepID=UPI00388E5B29
MSIPWLIFILIVVIIGQSYVLNKWGLRRIEYKRSFVPEPVFVGDEIEMVDEIANKKWLPILWLRLESKLHPNLQFVSEQQQQEIQDETFHRTLFTMMPFQRIKRRQKLVCKKRGYYRFESVSMTTGDVFGYSQSFQHFDAIVELTVYPKIVSIDDIPLPSHSWLGDLLVKRWIIEDPFLVTGVREYVRGDALNTINWKATARAGNFQVNQKGHTSDHQLLIYVNFDQTDDIWLPIADQELVEQGLSYAASIANFALAKGISTGFGSNSYLVEPFGKFQRIQPSTRTASNFGNNQLTYILDTMAKLKMDRSMSFEQFLQEDLNRNLTNTDIIIITSMTTQKMEARIQELKANGNAVEMVWVHADYQNQHKEGDNHAV